MRVLVYCIFSFLLFFSCSKKVESDKQQENKPSVIVFEQSLYPLKVKTPFKDIRPASTDIPVISYSSGETIKYYNPKKANDILVLNNPNNYAELRFACSFEDYSYLIAPNDTILFSIDEYGYPTLKSKTSKQLTELYNFPYRIKYNTPFFYYRPLTGLLRFGHHLVIIKKAQTKMPSLYEKFKHTYIPIDTLQKSFLLYQKNYRKRVDSLSQVSNISKEYIDYLEYRYKLDGYTYEMSKIECGRGLSEKADATLFFDDKYMPYPSYREFILQYLRFFFNIKEKIPINRGKQSVNVDWRKTYEKLSAKDYPIKTKLFMQ